MKPVNKKAVKDYYEKIKHPMDLETMTIKVKSRKYHSSHSFLVRNVGSSAVDDKMFLESRASKRKKLYLLTALF